MHHFLKLSRRYALLALIAAVALPGKVAAAPADAVGKTFKISATCVISSQESWVFDGSTISIASTQSGTFLGLLTIVDNGIPQAPVMFPPENNPVGDLTGGKVPLLIWTVVAFNGDVKLYINVNDASATSIGGEIQYHDNVTGQSVSCPFGVVTPSPLEITSVLPAGQAYSLTAIGSQYSAQLTATGGVPPYTWTVSGLPPGLNYDSASGAIFGSITSDVPDTYNVGVSVNDSSGFIGPRPAITLPLATYCGNPSEVPPAPGPKCGLPSPNVTPPAHGDARDLLVGQHTVRNVYFYAKPSNNSNVANRLVTRAPHCTDFTQNPGSTVFTTYQSFTSKAPKDGSLSAYVSCYGWTIASAALPGLVDAWIGRLKAAGDPSVNLREVSSSYRNPDRQAFVNPDPKAKLSVHQFGGAIDLSLVSACAIPGSCTTVERNAWRLEWNRVVDAAMLAGFARIEAPSKLIDSTGQLTFVGACVPGGQPCVHADMGTGAHFKYVNP